MKFSISIIFASLSVVAFSGKFIAGNDLDQEITSCKTAKTSGVYQLKDKNITVYCEMDSLGGGWTVFQQRLQNELNFNRSWVEYREGFGTIEEHYDFWLGLEHTHQLTKDGKCELAIEVKERTGKLKFAQYSRFRLEGEDDMYRLKVGNYSGNAGDELVYHGNDPFSTYDSDNDSVDDFNCAKKYNSGWWFKDCFSCNLNAYERPYWTLPTFYSTMMFRCK